MSNIEWTDITWNPVVGCTKVSDGCKNCYAEVMSNRLAGMARADQAAGRDPGKKVHHLAVIDHNGRWNNQVRLVPEALTDPLAWKKPRRVFVNSMSDLFHPDVPFDFIDRVYAVMALCPQHTFQILTKRPERMAEYFNARREQVMESEPASASTAWHVWTACSTWDTGPFGPGPVSPFMWSGFSHPGPGSKHVAGWPLRNVWHGTSVENQAAADERIPHLLRCPAAVRFLSCEPLLEFVDVTRPLCNSVEFRDAIGEAHAQGLVEIDDAIAALAKHHRERGGRSNIDWIIVGGESGHGARPCNVEWVRSVVQQCKAAGVACFVKQLGAWPRCDCMDPVHLAGVRCDIRCTKCGFRLKPKRAAQAGRQNHALMDTKGGDPAEWPEDLRVREWPRRVEIARAMSQAERDLDAWVQFVEQNGGVA